MLANLNEVLLPARQNGYGAVSYTHLDVYKRQVLFWVHLFLLHIVFFQ